MYTMHLMNNLITHKQQIIITFKLTHYGLEFYIQIYNNSTIYFMETISQNIFLINFHKHVGIIGIITS